MLDILLDGKKIHRLLAVIIMMSIIIVIVSDVAIIVVDISYGETVCRGVCVMLATSKVFANKVLKSALVW